MTGVGSLIRRVRRGFTLVELMVVVALMAMMSTLAIGSYSAITRGMSDRAALDAAKSFAYAALQRANLDRTNVYIYLFNEVTRTDTDTDAGIVCGLAVAVRPIGRITHVPENDFFCDEFGDLDDSYGAIKTAKGADSGDVVNEEEATTFFRIYNIAKQKSVTVREGVLAHEISDRDLESEGGDQDNGGGVQRTWTIHGFKAAAGDGDDNATFEVGDLYGQEFVATRLPPGYVFSKSVNMKATSDLGQKRVGSIIEVRPTQNSIPSFKVYARRPNGSFDEVGDTKGDGD